MTGDAAAVSPGMARRQVILVVLAVDLGVFLAALDSTIVGTAMPTVIGSLGGLSIYSWVFSAYLLTYTVSMPIFGKLSDLHGRKRYFLITIGVFVAGSALCGLAQSMVQLILFRAIQGLGGGGLLAIAITIFGDIFPPTERGRMQGYLAAVWGVSALVGPLAGGFIVDHWGWRWAFYVNLPLGALAAAMIGIALAETAARGARAPVDYAGAAALILGMTGILFVCLELGGASAGGPWRATTILLLSGILLVAFLVIEARAPEPILPLALFRDPSFVFTSVTSFLSGAGVFAAISFLPLFVQGVLGGSATDAGVALTPASLGWTVGSTVGGRLLNRLGYRVLGALGMGGMSVGYLLLTRLDAAATLGAVIWDAALVGSGMGFITIAIIVAVQNRIPLAHRGIGTSLVLFFRMIGATVGVAGLGAVMAGRLREGLAGMANAAALDPQLLLNPVGRAQIPAATLRALAGTLGEALGAVFWLGLLIALGGTVFSLFMPHSTPVRDQVAAGGKAILASQAGGSGRGN